MLQTAINVPTQHLWGNAMFVRDLARPERLDDDQLLKTAIIANHYGSPDLALAALMSFDSRYGSNTASVYAANFETSACAGQCNT